MDNASQDGSAEMVRQEFPEAILVASSVNTGYAAGNNLAFAQAQGDWLLTLNPDTEFTDNSLQQALEWMKEHQNVGALGITLIGPDGEVQNSVRGFPTLVGIAGSLTGLGQRKPGSNWASYDLPDFDYSQTQEAPQPMGTFLLFRREALAAVGDTRAPFDERFPIFFNEVDLLYRLHQSGWPTWYWAGGTIRHHHGASTKQVKKKMVWESHRSLGRYFAKHWRGPQRAWLPLVNLALWVGAFVRARGYDEGFRPQHHHL